MGSLQECVHAGSHRLQAGPEARDLVCFLAENLPVNDYAPMKVREDGYSFGPAAAILFTNMLFSRRTRCPARLYIAFAALLLLCVACWQTVRLLFSHNFDVSYDNIFDMQFRVYILTHECLRFTTSIASSFESVTVVPDVASTSCDALNQTQLHLPIATGTADERFKYKYSQVLEDCYVGGREHSDGGRMKCLILEDDIVFLHNGRRTRELLVQNTISLYGKEDSAYDCNKRGFGWLKSTHTGLGSRCRIYSRENALCLSQCCAASGEAHLDVGLRDCQAECGLIQRRFLLAVHGGLSSTMGRPGEF